MDAHRPADVEPEAKYQTKRHHPPYYYRANFYLIEGNTQKLKRYNAFLVIRYAPTQHLSHAYALLL